VRALEAQDCPHDSFEVVLVDDGSSDETSAVLAVASRSSSLTIRALTQAVSTGPARARNRGWRASSSDFIAFTDDDCEPTGGWLRAGIAALQHDDAVGIVQGRTLPEIGVPRTAWTNTREVLEPSPWFEGCNLFVRRKALESSGGFDETLGLGFEDTSMGWAILSLGWKRAFAADAVVHHATTDSGPRWHIKQGLLRVNFGAVAKHHPEFRRQLWSPWAVTAREAALAVGLLGAVVGFLWRPAVVLAAPYAWINRPFRPGRVWISRTVVWGVQDLASVAGMLRGSLRHRVLVV
jgi:GT2 family glycosyltransferase